MSDQLAQLQILPKLRIAGLAFAMVRCLGVVVTGLVLAAVSASMLGGGFSFSRMVSELQLYFEQFPNIGGISEILPWQWGDAGEGHNHELRWLEAERTFVKELKLLEKEFPHQKPETWIQLRATIANTLKAREPAHPAVITALLPPTMESRWATCFLSKVAVAVNKAVASVLKVGASAAPPKMLSPVTFEHQSISEVRRELDSYLRKEGKGILVENVDKFRNADSLLVFHGLADNYHAVDPRATLLFPVQVPEEIYASCRGWTHSLGADLSEQVLTSAWRDVLNADTVPALVARVADSVILLNEGDNCSALPEPTHSQCPSQDFLWESKYRKLEQRQNLTEAQVTRLQAEVQSLLTKVVALQEIVVKSVLAQVPPPPQKKSPSTGTNSSSGARPKSKTVPSNTAKGKPATAKTSNAKKSKTAPTNSAGTGKKAGKSATSKAGAKNQASQSKTAGKAKNAKEAKAPEKTPNRKPEKRTKGKSGAGGSSPVA